MLLGVENIHNSIFGFYQTAKSATDFYSDVHNNSIFFAYANINGLITSYLGFKASDSYGVVLTLGYGYGAYNTIGTLSGGNWTWTNLT